MGYRGKVEEQNKARDLRAQGWTLNEIVNELGVSKSSASLWCRDVEFDEEVWRARVGERRSHGWAHRRPSRLTIEKQDEIERLRAEAADSVGTMSERDVLVAGIALYAGEGAKTDGAVKFANSDPRMIAAFLSWLRRFFEVDEKRLRVRVYLHEGLDLEAAEQFWSELTGIPLSQFHKAYRAVPDPSIRKSKHPLGCPSVSYSCTPTHRSVMGLVEAVLTPGRWPTEVGPT
jgi:hypothetical protein